MTGEAEERAQTQRRGHVKTEAEVGTMQPQGRLEPPELEEAAGPSPGGSQGGSPAHTLAGTSASSLLFQTLCLWCSPRSPGALMHVDSYVFQGPGPSSAGRRVGGVHTGSWGQRDGPGLGLGLVLGTEVGGTTRRGGGRAGVPSRTPPRSVT